MPKIPVGKKHFAHAYCLMNCGHKREFMWFFLYIAVMHIYFNNKEKVDFKLCAHDVFLE